MERSGCQKFDRNSLAEILKSQGNKAMQLKLYPDATELYSCAIGLCDKNAVYYCNRAAALTQIHQYKEAIRDCQRSIEINPLYSKAYSRLGFAYYSEGHYIDAINEGYKKALQLDPNNDAVKENMRMAEEKLVLELLQANRGQASEGGGSADINNPLPGIRMGESNVNLNFLEQSFDISGALRAAMEVLNPPRENPQDATGR